MTERVDNPQLCYRLRGQIEQRELSFPLPPGECRIGSVEGNELVITVPGVSRWHARLSHGAEGLMLEDLDSRNGSFVNGHRIGRGEVRTGDVLRLGPVKLRLEEVDADDAKLGLVLRTPAPPAGDGALTSDLSTLTLGESVSCSEPNAWLVFPEGCVPGRSPAMTRLYQSMRPLVTSEIPVLIEGETGVGKEMVAQALHLSSNRGDGPYVAVNCAAIPADLLEAEMFGIGEGVATGVRKRAGTFRSAHGGTLFLDEIGEMPPALQVKLLRALQEKEVQPVGGRVEPIDVRVLAATNADLPRRVEEERFRRDLYYRVAGSVLRVPPLRERPEDVVPLVEHFLERFAAEAGKRIRGVTVKALDILAGSPWPGNVRELEHEVWRLVHLCAEGLVIDSSMLSGQIPRGEPRPLEAPVELAFEARVRQLETEMVTEALRQSRGVRRKAAKLLGISRNRLARKLKELGIEDTPD